MQEEQYSENDAGVLLPTRNEMYRNGMSPYRYQVCMMLMDTNQERSINLGDRYKFRPMETGECWINY